MTATALASTGEQTELWLAQALQLFHAGRIGDAEALYRHVLRQEPRNPDALHHLGVLRLDCGLPAEAATLIRKALAVRPAADACYHLALACERLGHTDEATTAYRAALVLQPAFAEAAGNLGALLIARGGSAQDAVVTLERALVLRRHDPLVLSNLGVRRLRRGEHAAAARCFRAALALRPDDADVLNNLISAELASNRNTETVALARRALRLRPDNAEALFSAGGALRLLGRLEESAAAQRAALALRPAFQEALCNLGTTLTDQGALDAAVTAQRRAIRLLPDFIEGHWNLALALLLQGRFAEGWAEYEWRMARPETRDDPRFFGRRLWRGERSEGGTLLVHAEQGLGDSIQFLRLLPGLAGRGWRVVMALQPPLLDLFAPLAEALPGLTFVADDGPLPPYDVRCPLLSLPHLLGLGPETIPVPIPYASVAPDKVAAWSGRLRNTSPDGFRVGIVWQGNPQAPVDRGRSFPLACFEPLARVPGVRLISLQKQFGLEQMASRPAGMEVHTLGPEWDSFADTAAVMMNLDLIVSTDTSVAHLAGALGRPVWLPVRRVPDWRWLLDRDDSPWYPTLRLFRQRAGEDWFALLRRVADALPPLVAAKAAPERRFPFTLVV